MTAKDTASIKIGVGVDPEFFAIDTEAMRLTSAHDLVPGTKEKPHPLKHGAVQVDGLAIEYNTEPAYNAKDFVKFNKEVIAQIRAMVPSKYEFLYKPAVFFDPYYFDKVPEHPKELGCSPDYCAYKRDINPRPVPPAGKETMRTGSGHIHVSWTKDADVDDPSHRFDCETVVQALDAFIYPYLKIFDKDTERATLYGKLGAFRYKSYGVEWRTPSNAWLNHPEIWEWLFEAVVHVVKQLLAGKITPTLYGDKALFRRYASSYAGNRFMHEWYFLNDVDPTFPKMPKVLLVENSEEAAQSDYSRKIKESKEKYRYKRLSPTSSTTTWDINLDIPQTDDVPMPNYLLQEAQVVHPAKGYGHD